MNEIVEYVECGCGAELLRIQLYKADDLDEIFFNMFSYGVKSRDNNPLSFRLRHIWKILKDGTPYEDEMCLNKESAIKLRDALDKMIKEMK